MKKKLFLLLPILFAFTYLDVSASCSRERIEELRYQIKNINFDLEYMKAGTIINGIEVSGRYKVVGSNFSNNIYLLLYENENTSYIVSDDYITYLSGGVYNARYYSSECGNEPIFAYQIMLPYYSENGKDNVWFDGTYSKEEKEEKENNDISEVNNKIKITLASIVLILLTATILLVFRKRRKIK